VEDRPCELQASLQLPFAQVGDLVHEDLPQPEGRAAGRLGDKRAVADHQSRAVVLDVAVELHRQHEAHHRDRMGEARQRVHRAQVRLITAVPALRDVDNLHGELLGKLCRKGLVPFEPMSYGGRLAGDDDGGRLRVFDPILRRSAIAVRIDGIERAALVAVRRQDHGPVGNERPSGARIFHAQDPFQAGIGPLGLRPLEVTQDELRGADRQKERSSDARHAPCGRPPARGEGAGHEAEAERERPDAQRRQCPGGRREPVRRQDDMALEPGAVCHHGEPEQEAGGGRDREENNPAEHRLGPKRKMYQNISDSPFHAKSLRLS